MFVLLNPASLVRFSGSRLCYLFPISDSNCLYSCDLQLWDFNSVQPETSVRNIRRGEEGQGL